MPYSGTKKEKRRKWRNWYHKTTPEKRKKYSTRRAERREKALKAIHDYKLTLHCSQCPENHPACLEFHHDGENGEKEFDIGNAANLGYSIKKIFEEIKKCIVLCANCHKKLHYNESHNEDNGSQTL
jgi:hypothetical protein